eukprot:UN05972
MIPQTPDILSTMTDSGSGLRNITLHVANMPGLEPNTKYTYKVGDADKGWSSEFTFMSPPEVGKPLKTQKFAVYGDLGVVNNQVVKLVTKEVT